MLIPYLFPNTLNSRREPTINFVLNLNRVRIEAHGHAAPFENLSFRLWSTSGSGSSGISTIRRNLMTEKRSGGEGGRDIEAGLGGLLRVCREPLTTPTPNTPRTICTTQAAAGPLSLENRPRHVMSLIVVGK
jgi:hypothetical protein